MENVLISGGAGFIGSNLAIKLKKIGYNVRVIDNLSPQVHGKNPKDSVLYKNLIKENIEVIVGSIESEQLWKQALEKQDILVHLAAETGTGQSMYEIEKYCKINIDSTAILFETLSKYAFQLKKIILASSRAIYGEGMYNCRNHKIVFPNSRKKDDLEKGDFECKCPYCFTELELLPTKESANINPVSIYGTTKYSQESISIISAKTLRIPITILRFQNVYGPGQSLINPYTGILTIFSSRILTNKDLNIFEDGKESRDFIFIDDVLDAITLSMIESKADNQIFNVGTGNPINILQVAEQLMQYYGRKVPIRITGNFRLGDIRHSIADASHIRKTIGFEPKINFKEGIFRFCNWAKEQYVDEHYFEKSIEELKTRGLLK